jgi:hypothetical protein
MTIYTPPQNSQLSNYSDRDKFNGQRVFDGTDDQLLVPKGVFFLEYLKAATTVDIKDGDGNTIVAGISDFQSDHSPLRCDHGIEFVGDVIFAKGFVLQGVFTA